MTQYRNTLFDLVHWALGDERAAAATLARAELDRMPVDHRSVTPDAAGSGFRRLDQALDQRHVDETFRVATRLGDILTDPDHLQTVVGSCATDDDPENDAACLSAFIHSFGARALRRPIDEADEAFYEVVHGGDEGSGPEAYADVIAVLLSAPELLYFVEHGHAEVPGEPGTFALTGHELASRLSYHFWQTLPDDALWQAADDGSLLDPHVLSREVDRLMSDDRTRETLTELFHDWLELEEVPALDALAQDPAYVAFAGSDLPGSSLRKQVIDEALNMLAHYTWTEPSGLETLLTSERSFAQDGLARIYGVPAWDEISEAPPLPRGERPGLLTRAWFLVAGSTTTRPIARGVFLRRNLLCDALPPPPPGVPAVPTTSHSGRSTRQLVEDLTEQPGSDCAGCHARINPLGFVFEGFDALGRIRNEQHVFGHDGALLDRLPLDTSAVPRVTPDDPGRVDDPAGLVERMLSSGKLEACLARNYFRFTFGRAEDLTRDGCALERLRARLVESGRVRDMIEEAALLPELRQRRFAP